MLALLAKADKLLDASLAACHATMFPWVLEVEQLQNKAIQRGKKLLLQEIDLQGRVIWLDNFALDKSRAQALDDELLDPTKARYHLWIFHNKRLLRFLTHGEIEHFLQSDDCSRSTLRLLDKDHGFRAFLSRPFACQFNFVLTSD